MSLFTKKETITLFSEQQKDSFIEKLESNHIDYKIKESNDSVFSNEIHYIVKVSAADLKKVV
ncbi:MAG: hypothetical protein K6F54_03800 [Lachnospiraceae bacterium]|nr:hypothetical protein [Lachnospiraceae bacterium]